jgi:hypothetical protein
VPDKKFQKVRRPEKKLTGMDRRDRDEKRE